MAENNPLLRLEKKAKLAHQTGKDDDITAAVEEAIDTSVFAGTDWAQPLKGKIGAAELRFRKGQHRGITEKALVDAVNHVVDQLGAAPYAKTSIEQVRMLRMSLIRFCPSVVATLPDENQHVSSVMTPLEASFVALMLVRQKLSNPDFQVTPQEWHSKGYGFSAAKTPGGSNAPRVVTQRPSDRSLELRKVISDAALHRSSADLQKIMNNALSEMGVQDQEAQQ